MLSTSVRISKCETPFLLNHTFKFPFPRKLLDPPRPAAGKPVLSPARPTSLLHVPCDARGEAGVTRGHIAILDDELRGGRHFGEEFLVFQENLSLELAVQSALVTIAGVPAGGPRRRRRPPHARLVAGVHGPETPRVQAAAPAVAALGADGFSAARREGAEGSSSLSCGSFSPSRALTQRGGGAPRLERNRVCCCLRLTGICVKQSLLLFASNRSSRRTRELQDRHLSHSLLYQSRGLAVLRPEVGRPSNSLRPAPSGPESRALCCFLKFEFVASDPLLYFRGHG